MTDRGRWLLRRLDVLYLLAALPVARLVPDVVAGFLVLPLFVILPLRTGLLPVRLLRSRSAAWPGGAAAAVSAWLLGMLLLVALSAVLGVLGVFSVATVSVVAVALTLASATGEAPALRLHRSGPVVAVAAVNAVAVFALLRSASPYPFQVGWDVFTEKLVVDGILGGFYTLYQPAFSSALHLFVKVPHLSLLKAVVMWLSGVPYLAVQWAGPLLLLFLFQVLLYLVARRGLRFDRSVALLAAFLSIWVMEVNKPSLIYFLQSSLALLLVPAVLLVYAELRRGERRATGYLLAGLVTLSFVATHFVVASLAVAAFVAAAAVVRMDRWGVALPSAAGGVVTYVALARAGWLDLKEVFTVNPAGMEGPVLSASAKLNTLYDWYTEPVLLLSVGALLLLGLVSLRRPVAEERAFVGLLFAGGVGAFLLPSPRIERVFPLLHLALPLLVALLLGRGLAVVRPEQRGAVAGILVVLLASVLVSPVGGFLDKQVERNTVSDAASTFSRNELVAAEWLRENAEEGEVVVSERETQNILGALSGVPSMGGPFPTQHNRETLRRAVLAEDPDEAHRLISELEPEEGDRVLLVLNGRTLKWVTGTGDTPVWHPTALREEDRRYVEPFLGDDRFDLVLHLDGAGDEVFVFRVSGGRHGP